MQNIYFHYTNHLGDLFRNTDATPLPDPKEDLETFLISFLDKYQSDERVFLLNEYYKLLYHEFETEAEELAFKEEDILSDIQTVERIEELGNLLRMEAYQNFHNLVFNTKKTVYKIGELKNL